MDILQVPGFRIIKPVSEKGSRRVFLGESERTGEKVVIPLLSDPDLAIQAHSITL